MKRLEINIQSPEKTESELNKIDSSGQDQGPLQDQQQQVRQQQNEYRYSSHDQYPNQYKNQFPIAKDQQLYKMKADYLDDQFDNIKMQGSDQQQKEEYEDYQQNQNQEYEQAGINGNQQLQNAKSILQTKNKATIQTFDFAQKRYANNYSKTNTNKHQSQCDSEVQRIINEVMNKNKQNNNIKQHPHHTKYQNTAGLATFKNIYNTQQNQHSTEIHNVNQTNRQIYSDNLILYKKICKMQTKLQKLIKFNKKSRHNPTKSSQSYHQQKQQKITAKVKKTEKGLELQKIMNKLCKAINMSFKLTERIDFQKSKLSITQNQNSVSRQKKSLSNNGNGSGHNSHTINLNIQRNKTQNQNLTYRITSSSLIQTNRYASKQHKNANIHKIADKLNKNSDKTDFYTSPILKYKDYVLSSKSKVQEGKPDNINNKNKDKSQKRSAIYIKDESSSYIPQHRNNPEALSYQVKEGQVLIRTDCKQVSASLQHQQFNKQWVLLQYQERKLIERIERNSVKIKRYEQNSYEQAMK